FCHSRLSSVEHSGEIARPTVIRAPAVSATLDEWQAEYVPGVKEKQGSRMARTPPLGTPSGGRLHPGRQRRCLPARAFGLSSAARAAAARRTGCSANGPPMLIFTERTLSG